jgi:hypothetical protein
MKAKLRIATDVDVKEGIRTLQAELERELEGVERMRKYFEAVREKEELTVKLQTVQGNLEALKTTDMETVARTRPHLMDREERKRYMEVEEKKREETSDFAKRLREEQHKRYLKQKEEFDALQRSIAAAQAQEAQRFQDKVDLLKQEKEERLRSIQEKAAQRKEYLRSMRKHAEEAVPPLKQGKYVGEIQAASHSADSKPFHALPKPSNHPSVHLSPSPPSPVPSKKYSLSPFLRKALQSEATQRAKALQISIDKRKRVEKTKRYAEIVKEMFAPAVDLMKQKELELIKHKLSNPVVKRVEGRGEEGKGEEEKSVQERRIRPRRKVDKIDAKSSESPKKVPVDYLARMHSERQSQLNRLLRDNSSLAEESSSVSFRQGEDPSLAHGEVRRLEKLAKRQELMLKRLNPLESVEVEAEVNSLVVSSVKAKLALLGQLN